MCVGHCRSKANQRQFGDEGVCVGLPRRLFDLLHGDALTSVSDVLCDRRAKQDRLLADDADLLAQPLEVEVLHVRPVDRYLHSGSYNELYSLTPTQCYGHTESLAAN